MDNKDNAFSQDFGLSLEDNIDDFEDSDFRFGFVNTIQDRSKRK